MVSGPATASRRAGEDSGGASGSGSGRRRRHARRSRDDGDAAPQPRRLRPSQPSDEVDRGLIQQARPWPVREELAGRARDANGLRDAASRSSSREASAAAAFLEMLRRDGETPGSLRTDGCGRTALKSGVEFPRPCHTCLAKLLLLKAAVRVKQVFACRPGMFCRTGLISCWTDFPAATKPRFTPI